MRTVNPWAVSSDVLVCLECLGDPIRPTTVTAEGRLYACPCGNTWTTAVRPARALLAGRRAA